MFFVNRIGLQVSTFQLAVSEVIGVSMAIFLLIQSYSTFYSDESQQATNYLSIIQAANINTPADVNIQKALKLKLLETIVKSIARTTDGINYVLLLNEGQVLVELAPVGFTAVSSNTVKQIEQSIYNLRLEHEAVSGFHILEYEKIFQSKSSSEVTANYVGINVDYRNITWIIGGKSRDDLRNSLPWLTSLVSVPF